MATWSLVPGLSVSVMSVQATTDSAPSSATDGQALSGVGGFNLTIQADPGQTLTGVGSLTGYIYDDLIGWTLGDIGVNVPAIASGSRSYTFSGWTVANPIERIAHICNGVGVSGGGVTLIYRCSTLRGFKT